MIVKWLLDYIKVHINRMKEIINDTENKDSLSRISEFSYHLGNYEAYMYILSLKNKNAYKKCKNEYTPVVNTLTDKYYELYTDFAYNVIFNRKDKLS